MVTAPILPTSFMLFLGTIGFALHLYLTTVVFRHASDHGMSPVRWAVIYFFTGPIGWVIFMLARDVGGLGGSSVAPGDIARERIVDLRRMDHVKRNVRDMLPKLSGNFRDKHSMDLISDREWEKAGEHAQEMRALAYENGNRDLASDYSRLLLWIDEKCNPFEVTCQEVNWK